MDCRFFERLVQLNIDGLLSAKEREEMQRHAQTCPSCAALLQDMTELEALLSTRLRPAAPPAGFARAVMAALPDAPAKRATGAKTRRRPIWWRFGTVAAAAALLLAAGLYSILPSHPGDNPPIDPPGPEIIVADNPIPNTNPGPVEPSSVDPKPNIPVPDPKGQDPEQDPHNTGAVVDKPDDPGTDEPPSAKPITQPIPEIIIEPDDSDDDDYDRYEAAIDLPIPALNLADFLPPPVDGVFSLAVLAAYEDCDAILPSFDEAGTVVFYTKFKNKNHKWKQALNVEEEAEYLEQVTTLPALPEIMGSMEESATAGFSRITALSPDGRNIAVNQGGEQAGIWLHKKGAATVDESPDKATQPELEQLEPGTRISAEGGGKILCWSPDSNKLIYTDSAGKLFVYHVFEKKIQLLYSGTVSCASWAKDSKTVLFSGKMDKKANSAIYTIIVP
jgi:hypothetical protein